MDVEIGIGAVDSPVNLAAVFHKRVKANLLFVLEEVKEDINHLNNFTFQRVNALAIIAVSQVMGTFQVDSGEVIDKRTIVVGIKPTLEIVKEIIVDVFIILVFSIEVIGTVNEMIKEKLNDDFKLNVNYKRVLDVILNFHRLQKELDKNVKDMLVPVFGPFLAFNFN